MHSRANVVEKGSFGYFSFKKLGPLVVGNF